MKAHAMKQGVRVRRSLGDRIVDVIIYIVLGLIALSTVLPFLYVVAGSLTTWATTPGHWATMSSTSALTP